MRFTQATLRAFVYTLVAVSYTSSRKLLVVAYDLLISIPFFSFDPYFVYSLERSSCFSTECLKDRLNQGNRWRKIAILHQIIKKFNQRNIENCIYIISCTDNVEAILKEISSKTNYTVQGGLKIDVPLETRHA